MKKDALMVAKYILKYCTDNNIKDCSNKKLQKLLYYVQAWSLAFRDKPIFLDKIEAWLHGPTVRSVHYKYKYYWVDPITIDIPEIDINVFSQDDIDLMHGVLGKYAKYDADYLEMRTHIEKPWREARNSDKQIITCDAMKKYYSEVLEESKDN